VVVVVVGNGAKMSISNEYLQVIEIKERAFLLTIERLLVRRIAMTIHLCLNYHKFIKLNSFGQVLAKFSNHLDFIRRSILSVLYPGCLCGSQDILFSGAVN
jgi:hypothetical protein